jgi:hypothetical protein
VQVAAAKRSGFSLGFDQAVGAELRKIQPKIG